MRTFLLVAATAILASCGGGGGGSDSSYAVDLRMSTVLKTTYSAIKAPETVVVQSQSDWKALWSRHTANTTPPPDATTVDFDSVQVVGVFLGSRPSGCYSIEITRVVQSATNLNVHYTEHVPTSTSICTAVFVDPVHLITIPKSALPVGFQRD